MFLNDINVHNILVSDKISYDEKNYGFFVGYVDKNKIKLFSIILPKMNTYVKSYDAETKQMYFSIEDNELFKKYNNIWIDVSSSMKREFDSKPIHNERSLISKIKSYTDEAVDFHYQLILFFEKIKTIMRKCF